MGYVGVRSPSFASKRFQRAHPNNRKSAAKSQRPSWSPARLPPLHAGRLHITFYFLLIHGKHLKARASREVRNRRAAGEARTLGPQRSAPGKRRMIPTPSIPILENTPMCFPTSKAKLLTPRASASAQPGVPDKMCRKEPEKESKVAELSG